MRRADGGEVRAILVDALPSWRGTGGDVASIYRRKCNGTRTIAQDGESSRGLAKGAGAGHAGARQAGRVKMAGKIATRAPLRQARRTRAHRRVDTAAREWRIMHPPMTWVALCANPTPLYSTAGSESAAASQ